jgi:hypothetical protein
MWVLCLGSALLVVTACAGRQAQPETAAAPEKAPAQQAAPEKAPAPKAGEPDATKLAKSYPKVLCYTFTSTPEVSKNYPKAADDVQHSMMTALSLKKAFQEVGVTSGGKADAQTLLVKATVTELRIVSSGARIWGGAFAGKSNVALDIELIDGATQKIVRQEKISTANNAWGASYSGGSTDKSLLSDMGKILADYITAVNSK